MTSTSPSETAAAPSALIDVTHETRYRYARAVELAQHMAYLRPIDDAAQELLRFEMDVEPAPSHHSSARDVFGNCRTVFTQTVPHEMLRVVAHSRVRLRARPALTSAALPWETLRERWRYVAKRPFDAPAEFVFASPMIPNLAPLRDYALASFTPGRPADEAARDLTRRIFKDFKYAPASTHVGTPVLEAFTLRRGVCQDFAHVMIGCLRTLGLAARYVSGYLLTEPPPGQPRLMGADASHAWASMAVVGEDKEMVWMELDPTNDCEAGLGHVRLAVGRDYGDVTPLRGVIRGGGRHALDVRVSTIPVDEAVPVGTIPA